jgi:6-pyruvoyltetrahydropterin/6-carboxytetrahydropterin synthase
MVELKVKSNFAAAHHLNGYKGDCSQTHGHTFSVIVLVRVEKLNEIGIGIDFKELKKEIEHYLKQLDHKYLNDLMPFKNVNPTSENIAIWLFNSLTENLAPQKVKVYSVTIEESDKYSATYYGD